MGEQLSVDAVARYVNEIKNIDDDNLAVEGDHQKEDNVYSISMAAGVGVSDKDGSTFTAFKTLLSCGGIEDVSQCASDLVEPLQLGKLEKGAATTASKFKSLKGRWFSQKGDHETVDSDKDGERYIQCDSLIKVHCKCGEIISVENYRVLGVFTKHQNKWFVSTEGRSIIRFR